MPRRNAPAPSAGNKPALKNLLIDYCKTGEVSVNDPITYGDLIHLLETGNDPEHGVIKK